MAKYIGPKTKLERRFGLSGREAKIKSRRSVYGIQLEEKQKLKFIYGLMERQFKRYVDEAKNSKEIPGIYLLIKLETRLDNAVYRLGWAKTRPQARQMVSHGQIKVDAEKVNRPSFEVKTGQVIELKKTIYKKISLDGGNEKRELPSWIFKEANRAKILGRPQKNDLRRDVEINNVMEFYT